jgi:transmembrane sensor
MPEKKIKELLRKYLEGRATPEEEKLVDDWYESLSGVHEKVGLSDSERGILRSFYWNSISKKIHSGSAEGRDRGLWSKKIMGLAASVAALVMVSIFLLPSQVDDSGVSEVAAHSVQQEIRNETDQIRHVVLPDNSSIRLFPGSKLQYGGDFNGSDRRVRLSGQAFFKISHNPEKPFYVLANEVVTKVLGTKFCVKAYPDDMRVTVAVRSGKVSVYTHAEKNRGLSDEETIILTPNQQAVYTRNDRKVSRTLVKDPEIVIPKEQVAKIRFDGVPVSEIFRTLEKMYNVEIVFDENVFSKCPITTSVAGHDLYERIDVICEITGSSYRIENTTIVIAGSGCN